MHRNPLPALALFFLCVVFSHCSQPGQSVARLFRPDSLPSFLADIDITKDTILHTPGGGMLTIPANALQAGGATRVKLVVKEAFRLSDIIRAGLLTVSDNRTLSSGGMIDIEAAAGQTVTITKAISVHIPTPVLDKNMQLYKGVPDKNGNLNWTDPQPLPANPQLTKLDLSRQLFQSHCASCHGIGRDGTGPDLAYIALLRDKKWLFHFTKNSLQLLASGEPYANCLYEQRNKTPMPLFPNLADADLDALYSFIDNESARLGLPLPSDHDKKCADSCAVYLRQKTKLLRRRQQLVKDNGPAVNWDKKFPIPDTFPDIIPDTVIVPGDTIRKVTPTDFQSEYYQFNITTFGWYNIDILLKGVDGVKESELIVRLRGEYRSQVNLFLAIPSARVFQRGGPLEGQADTYGFYATNGKILLPQGVKALLLAMGEQEGKLVFSMLSFQITEKQSIELTPVPITKKEMNAQLRALDLQEITIQAQNSKNAAAVRTTDTRLRNIDHLKPRNCDCNCGDRGVDTTVSPGPVKK